MHLGWPDFRCPQHLPRLWQRFRLWLTFDSSKFKCSIFMHSLLWQRCETCSELAGVGSENSSGWLTKYIALWTVIGFLKTPIVTLTTPYVGSWFFPLAVPPVQTRQNPSSCDFASSLSFSLETRASICNKEGQS